MIPLPAWVAYQRNVDLADAGAMRLEDVGAPMSLTCSRVRQIESMAIGRLTDAMAKALR